VPIPAVHEYTAAGARGGNALAGSGQADVIV